MRNRRAHPGAAGLGKTTCLSCEGKTRCVHFGREVPSHYYCDKCELLYVMEMGWLLPCVSAKHRRVAVPRKSVA